MRKLSLLVCSLLMLSLAACAAVHKRSSDITDWPGGGGGGDAAPAATASVMGKISFEGEVPKPVKIPTTADPNCKKELFSEDTIVKDGGLENVIIYVSGGDVVPARIMPRRQRLWKSIRWIATIFRMPLCCRWVRTWHQKQRYDAAQHPCI